MKNKASLRNYVWGFMKKNGLFKPPKDPYGKIPDFIGSIKAARKLRESNEWDKSQIIFCSPDTAQNKVREFALTDMKQLIMASPKLKNGFLLINPFHAEGNEKIASTIKGAFKFGKPILDFPEIDMVVEGSVAVDLNGNRLGKGGGYADMEISHLFKQKAIDNITPIVTTIHEAQIIDYVPAESHDMKINMIITPKRIIRLN